MSDTEATTRRDLDSVRNATRTLIAAVGALHAQTADDAGVCAECGQAVPCATRRILATLTPMGCALAGGLPHTDWLRGRG